MVRALASGESWRRRNARYENDRSIVHAAQVRGELYEERGLPRAHRTARER